MTRSEGALSPEEVDRRIPTLRLIDDDRICVLTARITTQVPDYFWEVPASKSGYHHPICRKKHGLWAHTLMLSTVIERLGDSYVQQGLLEPEDIDLAHAAAILHDQRKNGLPPNHANKSVGDHEILMADVIRESPLDDRVADAVESHMGPWYDGPQPETHLDQLVHTADMVASTESITPAVQGPIPEELQDRDLQEVDLT